jgi:hypothetical protein
VKVVLDNIKEIGEWNDRAIPLQEVYETSESMALDAAKAAAKSNGGVLDASSARFLPFEFQAEFELLTGVKIDDAPGAAVPGVKIDLKGNDAKVTIDFEKALAGQTAKKVVLGLTQNAAIIAEKVTPAADPNLPPYWIYISARPGKADDTYLKRDSGISGFSSDSGSLIRAGKTRIELVDSSATEVKGTLQFTLDKVNDLGSEIKEPSAKTKVVREAWIKTFNEDYVTFDFEKGLASGKLQKLSRADFEKITGAKTLLSSIRAETGVSITKRVEQGRLQFVRDPKSGSAAALLLPDGPGTSLLYVLDEKAKRWVGTWRAADDGVTDWLER